VSDVYEAPAHPYTLGLMGASPSAHHARRDIQPIPGYPPDFARLPSGCVFHPRCPYARDRCRTEPPPLTQVAPGRLSACHFAEEVRSDATSGRADA
ncbi:MAG: oligopeptide/dipeptide ABC transporter ATP-binding protein, partial [Micromonosporaceae bacterium]